jgi:hypothetical protein
MARIEWHRLGTFFADRRTAHAFCVLLAVVLVVADASRGLGAIEEARHHARSMGAELVVKGPGDVTIRDIPKALDFKSGRLLGDPHYAGEVNWYPFVTPLIAALASVATGARINDAYLDMGVVMGALFIGALGVLLASCARTPIAVLVLPLAMLVGLVSSDDGVYPYQTARAPLVLYLAFAGAAMASDLVEEDRRRARRAHAGAGALNGILAVWQGSSFVAASAVSFVLLATLAVRFVRQPGTRREALMRAGLLAAPIAAIASVLFLPQLLRYGAIVQSDAARLWLETYYNGGNDPGALFALALLPRGWDALWLLAFAAALIVAGRRRRRAIPLAVAFVVMKGLAHAGFVVHSAEYPRLAAISAKLLVVPAGSLNGTGEFVFMLMKLWVVLLAGSALIALARRRFGPRVVANGPPQPEQAGSAHALAAAAAVLLAFVSVWVPTRRDDVFAQAISREWLLFAEQTAREIGPDATVVAAEPFIALARFNLLWLPFSAHANPYVAAERETAALSLLRSTEMGDRAVAGEILRRYDVRYAIGESPLTRTCGEAILTRAPNGVPVVKLRPGCGE